MITQRRSIPQVAATIAALTGMALATIAVVGQRAPTRAQTVDERPNILVILTDDQREGLEVMPATRKWLEQRGTTYTNAFASTPTCCPSRATLLTGQYSHNTGVHFNGDALNLREEDTVQRYLSEAGYRTGYFGKFLNPWPIERNPRYFSDWAILPRAVAEAYADGLWNVRGTVRQGRGYHTTFIGRRARRFLDTSEGNDGQPWLMFLAPIAPHHPYTPQAKYEGVRVPAKASTPGAFETDLTDKPQYIQDFRVATAGGGRWTRKKQLRTLMSVDDMVERVFGWLSRYGEGRRTLVVFTSDNGYMWGEHGWNRKSVPYTESIRVPFLLRWPERVAPGGVNPGFITLADVAPTILSAAGVPADSPAMDGRSLFEPNTRERILLEDWGVGGNYDVPPWASLRTSAYQYTEYYDEEGLLSSREYYDLTTDPFQLTNLLGDQDPTNDPPIDEQIALNQQLEQDRECAGNEGPSACP